MKLILIRHGETEGNHKGVYQGVKDYPLSEEGKLQNLKLKSKLENMNVNKVYYSTMERAKKTAEAIFDFSSSKIYFEENLSFNEINFGVWDGKDYKYISTNYSEQFQSFIDDFRIFKFPEGESFKDFYNRVSEEIKEIIKVSDEEDNIAIVAHGGTIKVILCELLGFNYEGFYKFNINHGCYSMLTVYEDSAILEFLNK
ncbi:alpha-ribazole phosphatase [Clostridium folliculivorans]|uniref:Alpha-ribazole phosphatase n=1 Tax=Clostridium folliculivorans TaxID=2886038 RepID=A0A9W5Y571_9CLOT|nr:alpha-ribazole phosphatase [Clostridium folliculivorans]GKU26750.1 alpha-ribazole phosphatase [Clostridium folliculivorans]GKU31344.1 alpha-ribazole phosphatase [Clostridium folliculivorans]